MISLQGCKILSHSIMKVFTFILKLDTQIVFHVSPVPEATYPYQCSSLYCFNTVIFLYEHLHKLTSVRESLHDLLSRCVHTIKSVHTRTGQVGYGEKAFWAAGDFLKEATETN